MTSPHSLLETARMTLRPFQPADVEAAFSWFSDPEVMRFIPNGADGTLEHSAARITRYLEHETRYGFSKWIILDKESGHAIGDSGFFHLPNSDRVELGYRLSRSWWNRGAATEVASKWVEVARSWYGFEKVYCFALPENAASIRVMEKVGFCYSHQERLYGFDAPLYSMDLIPDIVAAQPAIQPAPSRLKSSQ
jgi:ribosomal-protein-alanine N-acetyltransferase